MCMSGKYRSLHPLPRLECVYGTISVQMHACQAFPQGFRRELNLLRLARNDLLAIRRNSCHCCRGDCMSQFCLLCDFGGIRALCFVSVARLGCTMSASAVAPHRWPHDVVACLSARSAHVWLAQFEAVGFAFACSLGAQVPQLLCTVRLWRLCVDGIVAQGKRLAQRHRCIPHGSEARCLIGRVS